MFALAENGFIVCLGVILLIGGLIVYYVKQKLDFVEKKIGSMFEIVSALTTEVNNISNGSKYNLQSSGQVGGNNNSFPTQNINENDNKNEELIEVSDNELDEDSEDDTDSVSSESDDENYDLTRNLNISGENTDNNIKVVEMDIHTLTSSFSNPYEHLSKTNLFESKITEDVEDDEIGSENSENSKNNNDDENNNVVHLEEIADKTTEPQIKSNSVEEIEDKVDNNSEKKETSLVTDNVPNYKKLKKDDLIKILESS